MRNQPKQPDEPETQAPQPAPEASPASFWARAKTAITACWLAFVAGTKRISRALWVRLRHLPGWVFNVAAIFHGEEAFLAAVFLFTVHFFNNHFRPDKFPLEIVRFTGTVALADYQRDHPLEYRRLVDSGELEKHLVDAPSETMTKGSTILGFALIVCGLGLLTLVGIGFLSGA